MRMIFCKLLVISIALIFSTGAYAVSPSGDCAAEVQKSQMPETQRTCVDKVDAKSALDSRVLYASTDSVVIFRTGERGTSVLGVVSVVLLIPGVAILFGSWLAKSGK